MSHLSSEATSATHIPKFCVASNEQVSYTAGLLVAGGYADWPPQATCYPVDHHVFSHWLSSRLVHVPSGMLLPQIHAWKLPNSIHVFTHMPPSQQGLPRTSYLKLHLCLQPSPWSTFSFFPLHLTPFSKPIIYLFFCCQCLSPLLDSSLWEQTSVFHSST